MFHARWTSKRSGDTSTCHCIKCRIDLEILMQFTLKTVKRRCPTSALVRWDSCPEGSIGLAGWSVWTPRVDRIPIWASNANTRLNLDLSSTRFAAFRPPAWKDEVSSSRSIFARVGSWIYFVTLFEYLVAAILKSRGWDKQVYNHGLLVAGQYLIMLVSSIS